MIDIINAFGNLLPAAQCLICGSVLAIIYMTFLFLEGTRNAILGFLDGKK